MVNLADKDFEAAVIDIFKELKEIIYKELKKDMMILSIK